MAGAGEGGAEEPVEVPAEALGLAPDRAGGAAWAAEAGAPGPAGRRDQDGGVGRRGALPRVIAIDGPAGAGKSTVALELAGRLGYFYFDTGALYRAVTLAALRRGIPVDDREALARLVKAIHIDVEPPRVADGRMQTVLLDGEDVTWATRAPEVDRNVSTVSAFPEVRQALLQRQRAVAARGGVIMAGRDIGTVVLPDADLKIYLEATPEERARRRAAEERARGLERPFAEVLADIERRDDIDAHRALSPLRPADDAVIVDTERLDIGGVLAAIERIIAERAERSHGGDGHG